MRLRCRYVLAGLVFFLCSPFSTVVAYSQSGIAVNLEAVRKSVVFICARDQQGNEAPNGTGFIVAIPSKLDPNRGYLLLVTARHMIDSTWTGCPAAGDLVAKFNKKLFDPQKDEDGTIDWPLKNQQWIVPLNDSVDIAYTFLDGLHFESLKSENQAVHISQLPSASEVKAIGIGAQVVSAGLLPGASGTRRNYPIFKFGYVSSIPEEKVPMAVCANKTKLTTNWMIAASLVGGNSGSPIVYSPPMYQGGRAVILGVQSNSFLGYDVAGMAPIRFLLESLRQLNLADADLSKPEEPGLVPEAAPTSATPAFPVSPGPLPKPR